jgi:hypothetical protein
MAENKDKYNEARRLKNATDPKARQRTSELRAQWREKNSDQLSARAREIWAAKTPKEKLRTYFGAAISHSLKGRGKGGKGWQDILGYTADDLRTHLERQFTRGMTWDNYGKWHVDHILPVASFIYETVECDEFLACWAITNLRPLWAKENISKSDTRLHLI